MSLYDKNGLSPLWLKIKADSQSSRKSVGQRVAFVSCKYTIGENNPVIGSHYECFGTVREVTGGGVQVRWDNEHNNSYQHDDLMLIRENNPNILFRLKKKKH